MKFKAGDKIRVLGSDRVSHRYAVITSTKEAHGKAVYYILWDGTDKIYDYDASDVDDVWELTDVFPKGVCPVITASKNYTVTIPENYTIVLPVPNYDGKSYKIINKGCDHVWMEYNGFTENYQFCYKCDEKRKHEN